LHFQRLAEIPVYVNTFIPILIFCVALVVSIVIVWLRSDRIKKEIQLQAMEDLEHERQRIAHDLHDASGARFFAIKERITELLNHGEISEIVSRASQIQKELQDLQVEIAQLTQTIYPKELEAFGLVKSIENLVMMMADPKRKVNFQSSVTEISLAEKEVQVYRIMQELIANIVQHNQVDVLSVSIQLLNQHLTISINYHTVSASSQASQSQFSLSNLAMDNLKGRGTYTLKQRLALIQGEIRKIELQPGVWEEQLLLEVNR
jgi:two-component system sensor histidine kinase DesK